MKTVSKKLLIITAAMTACAMYGFWYTLSLSGIKGFYNTLLLLVAVPVGMLTYKTLGIIDGCRTDDGKIDEKGSIIAAAVLSYIAAIVLIFGTQLKYFGATSGGFRGKGLILARGLMLGCFIFPFLYFFFSFLKKKSRVQTLDTKAEHCIRKYFIAFGGIFAAYIPVFLAYYPAIMAYDFHRQSQEAVRGFAFFYPYQPLIHTWLYWLFFKIGNAFGSLQTGMAFYSIFQMLIFSAALAYGAVMVYRLTAKKWAYILTVIFFAFFPFISVMSVEATKDVIFTALFITFLLLIIELLMFEHSRKCKFILSALLVICGMFMVLFRNNAIYAAVPFIIVAVIIAHKKDKLKIVITGIVFVAVGEAAIIAMPKIIGTEIPSPQIEKYSLIVQTFGRVGYYHENDMDSETEEIISKYISKDMWSSYNPSISDTLKANAWNDNWAKGIRYVLADWIKVGLKYPNEYIDAFFQTNAGYLFPDDETWCEMLGSGLEGRMGAIYTYTSNTSDAIPEGIAHESKFPALEKFLEKIVSANWFYRWPFLSVFCKPATYTWLLGLAFAAAIFLKKRNNLIILMYPICYFLTMLLGPCAHWRYVLPFVIFAPVMIAMMFCHIENKNSDREK